MNEKIEAILDNSIKYKKVNNKYFYTDVPNDIEINNKSSNYNEWSDWRKSNYAFFEKELSNSNSNLLLLDVGAGPSQFRELFKRFTTIGADYFPYEMVQIVTDLSKVLPIKSESFDIVIMSNVIEHIPDTKLLIDECNRILKKGGKVIATVPFIMREHQKPYDFNRYTHFGLEYNFRKFSKIKVEPLGDPFDVYNSIQRQFWLNYINKNFFVKLIYILERLIFKFAKKYIKSKGSSLEFTEGYGLIAIK